MNTTTPDHLSPSELGTKEYWDTTYTADLSTHTHHLTHTGTTWFSDSLASQKTLSHLLSLTNPPLSPASTTFLDLGTGNGELLFHLRGPNGPFTGRMLGIDYSPASVELASRIAKEKGYTENEVGFKEWDILSDREWKEGEFDVVLDKGTFDAVSLSAETEERTGRRVCEGYAAKVVRMVKKGGRFLVTSCNWTEEELRGWFEKGKGEGDANQENEDGGFEFEGRVEYPRFKFGGKEGQSVYGVCFRRM
ncbi:MAG: hypothetical protein LQ338_003482 [Usnochroma carphineum]|nr:MAG: hypothetical protein LQ338_003482 [Usnochroma carphineum]